MTPNFVVAAPARTNYYNAYAQVLDKVKRLRFYALGTRRGAPGVPHERTRLNPWIGLFGYASGRVLSPFQEESFRFRLLPWFDRWVLKQLEPGDNIISSFGYTNECFRFVHRNGGKTFVEAGNSHIENFWEVLGDEHRRWKCPYPPVARYWYERSRAMLAEGPDYVLSPSNYVTQSFLSRGFRPEQILKNPFPIDLDCFNPSAAPRPKGRPLTVINTGNLSLRKGTPYLLEAFRIVHQRYPSARFLLTQNVRDDVKPILSRYRDLPIEWSPGLPHVQLAERLRSADVFVLPSLEEGLVRTACEAMACGLQVVLTPNCGANDFVNTGVNGEVVPIRDPKATADAILKCWERVQNGCATSAKDLQEKLSFETFAKNFVKQLSSLGFVNLK
ncbi:MAG: glycosyltransferase [Verrucomicrobiota bacterium]